MSSNPDHHTMIETTLYDLISALSDELDSEEEDLILPIVVHLLNSGRIRFIEGLQQYKVTCTEK